jgi:colanic acid biosynthesis glycosyl transferase WcaI
MHLLPKPSILFINRYYPPAKSGSSHILMDLAQAFARDGWDVKILTTGTSHSIQNQTSDPHGVVQIIRTKASPRRNLWGHFRNWLSLLKVARKIPRTDLIVTMTDPPFLVLIGRYLAQKHRNHHIHWCQDLYPDMFPIVGQNLPDFLMKRLTILSRQAMASCDRIIVVGRCMARVLAQNGIDQKKLSFIPNWMASPQDIKKKETANSNTLSAPVSDTGKELVVDTTPKFRVLYNSTINRLTPVSVIIEAASLLSHNHPEIEFLFIGEGKAYEKIAEERSKKGLDNIRLLPPQPDSRTYEIHQSGDIHLLSFKSEATGMIVPMQVYEAFAAERPCILISSEDTEIAKTILDYKAGSVLPPQDPKALAQVILDYRHSEEKWVNAQQGAQRAAHDFAPETSLSIWLAKARDVIGAKAA